MRRTSVMATGLALAAAAALAGTASPASASGATPLYNSTISPLPGNVGSWAFEATQTSEFGNQITLSRAGHLGSVVVTMSSWACQSGSGSAGGGCTTTPGATFTEPITLNIYQANAPGSTLPGALITSRTKTFAIPYRPSASPKCTGAQAGDWYDGSQGCFSGKAVNITFGFDRVIPGSIVFGIAYNTSDYGASPYGAQACQSTTAGCPYDSLNVALSTRAPSSGSDPNPGRVFMNNANPAEYCDSGAAGTGSFRLDSPGTSPSDRCWTVGASGSPPYYIPAVKLTVN